MQYIYRLFVDVNEYLIAILSGIIVIQQTKANYRRIDVKWFVSLFALLVIGLSCLNISKQTFDKEYSRNVGVFKLNTAEGDPILHVGDGAMSLKFNNNYLDLSLITSPELRDSFWEGMQFTARIEDDLLYLNTIPLAVRCFT